MEPWYRNIEVLLLKDPALAELVLRCSDSDEVSFGRAKNGEPIAKRDGICLHSSYDPTREAAEWLKTIDRDSSVPLTVLGLGLGYHIKALAEAGFRGAFVEPDPALFRIALKHLDLTRVLEQFEPIVGVPLDKLRRSRRDLLAGETIPHPASLRTSPDYIGELAEYARSLALIRKGGLRILLVNPIYGGSLPAARHCATALEQMGHEVGVFSAESFASGMVFADRFSRPAHRTNFQGGMVSFLSQGVEMMAREFEPDLILALAQAPLQQPELGHLEQMGIPTAFWFVEDYRVLPYWREVAPAYSYFFTIQQGDFPTELARSGVRRQSYLPTSAAPEMHMPLELSGTDRMVYGSPLSFVGAGYYNRQRFFRGLTDYPFKIWGSDWPLELPLKSFIQRDAARIDTETCVKIFNASEINLNLHSSSHHEGVDPAGDFVNPRTFEIACCNAFQLVDRRSLMAGLFDEDEMETFGDMTELRDKIDHFLARPESRRDSAEKARLRVMEEHTYSARMEELLAMMVREFPIISEKQQLRLDRREACLAEMSDLDGISFILSRIPPGKSVRLPDIYRSIEVNQGELSRTEKIFLMLKNIEVAQEVGR